MGLIEESDGDGSPGGGESSQIFQQVLFSRAAYNINILYARQINTLVIYRKIIMCYLNKRKGQ